MNKAEKLCLIPEEINEEEVKGGYKNGLLEITLPMKNLEKE